MVNVDEEIGNMLDAFYVNDQPELKFLSDIKNNNKKSPAFVSTDFSNSRNVDAAQEYQMTGIETEIVTDAQRSNQNEQSNSYSTYQVSAHKNNTQVSSDVIGTGKKNNEALSNQNTSSNRHYGSSYSQKRNENDAVFQQLQNQRTILRFRNNARKEQNITDAKEHKLDLLKKVYRLPFDARPVGLSQSVIRSISQKHFGNKMHTLRDLKGQTEPSFKDQQLLLRYYQQRNMLNSASQVEPIALLDFNMIKKQSTFNLRGIADPQRRPKQA